MAELAGMGDVTDDVAEEANSAIATTIGQVMAIVRTVIKAVLRYMEKIVTWIGEHPKAASMFFMNLLIWFS